MNASGSSASLILRPKERHPRAVLLRLGDQLEGVERGPTAAAQHADDHRRIVVYQFLQGLWAEERDLQKLRPRVARRPGKGSHDVIVHESADVLGAIPASTFGANTSRK